MSAYTSLNRALLTSALLSSALVFVPLPVAAAPSDTAAPSDSTAPSDSAAPPDSAAPSDPAGVGDQAASTEEKDAAEPATSSDKKSASEEKVSEEKEESAGEALAALDHVELLARLEESDRELDRLQEVFRVPSDVLNVKEVLRERVPALDAAAKRARKDILHASRWYVVSDIQFDFTGRAMRLAEIRAPLDSYSSMIASAPKRLEEITAEWREARDILVQVKAPEAVLTRASELLRKANLTKLSASRAQATVAQVGAVVNRMDATINDVLELSHREAPSLISDFSHRTVREKGAPLESTKQIVESIRFVLDANLKNLEVFTRLNRPRVALHGLLLVLFIFSLYRARSFYRKQDGPGEESQHFVLKHPLAGAFLLSAISTAVLYPVIPAIAAFVAITVGVIAAHFLLAGKEASKLLLSASLTILFFIGAHILLVETPGVERLMLAAEGVCVLLGSLLILYGKTLSWRGAWNTALRIIARLWVGTSLIGLLLLFLEFDRSATTLIDGTARVMLITIAFRVGHDVLVSIITLGIASPWGQKLRIFSLYGVLITERLKTVLKWIFLYAWVKFCLRSYILIGHTTDLIDSILAEKVEAGSISLSVGDVVTVLFGVVVAVVVARLLRFALGVDVLPRTKLALGTQAAVNSGAYYVVLGFGIFTTLAASGFQLDRVAILVSALGVGIGFGLQNVVQNFVAGILLMFGRPINVGDTVQVGDLIGKVREIGFRASTVYTVDGAEVIVPNSQFVSEQVINWTLSSERRRVIVDVGVKYGTEPKTVLEILMRIAQAHELVLKDPAPEAVFLSFGDSALNFQLRAWTDKGGDWVILRSDLSIGIDAALKEAGIEIPFPQRDLHLRSVSDEVAAVLSQKVAPKRAVPDSV